jgi:hypothetical protein
MDKLYYPRLMSFIVEKFPSSTFCFDLPMYVCTVLYSGKSSIKFGYKKIRSKKSRASVPLSHWDRL